MEPFTGWREAPRVAEVWGDIILEACLCGGEATLGSRDYVLT